MTTFLDTNVIISLMNPQENFHQWAKAAVTKCRTAGPLVLTDIVYSEMSVGFDSVEAVNEAIARFALERVGFSDAALFRAALAFKEYRFKNKGPKTNVLSDFLIGAQAETAGLPLLTNNRKDYHSYFPELRLIEPA